MHTIDLKSFSVRTDLIMDSAPKDYPGIEHIEQEKIQIDRMELVKDDTSLNKKAGKYVTLTFEDVSDKDNFKKVEKYFIDELKQVLSSYSYETDDTILVVGLGNSKSTPDSLGPKVIDQILVTRYLFELGDVEDGYQKVASFRPEVTGVTGIETLEILRALVKTTQAKLIIIVDALASSSIQRVNKTIQITNSGIHPGSGVGNDRKEISFDTLGIPVIAIGVPTIVDAATIVTDTFQCMMRQFSFKLDNLNNQKLKLVHVNMQDYRNHPDNLSIDLKEQILGMVGTLSEEEFKSLIYEVLSPIESNLMVTPKEVDFMVRKLALLIGNGINKSLHENFNPTN